jgi:hypothetical protein
MRMVNDKFLASRAYGFEMVDASAAHFWGRNSHQSKIYTESNHSDFPRIFAGLISMQTLAIYRRLLVRDRLRGIKRNGIKKRRLGSRDVFSAPHGVLARAGARAVAKGKDA